MPYVLPDEMSETVTKNCCGGDHSKQSEFSFETEDVYKVYPLVIKHGLLENPPLS